MDIECFPRLELRTRAASMYCIDMYCVCVARNYITDLRVSNPRPWTLDPGPETLDFGPWTLHPIPS